MMDVKCVFFDVGNTLIYPLPSVGEAYAHALRKGGIEADAHEVEQHFRRAWTTLRVHHGSEGLCYGSTEAEARRWWRKVVMSTLEHFGTLDDPGLAFEQIWNHFASPEAWRVFPDAVPALEKLKKRGIGVGLISNWDSRLPSLLRGLGIRDAFDVAVVSFQIGVEKPDPRIFRNALSKCCLPPERAVHVGDNYHEDVLGARAAGMRAVLLRRGEGMPNDSRDVEVIDTLAEVPWLVHKR